MDTNNERVIVSTDDVIIDDNTPVQSNDKSGRNDDVLWNKHIALVNDLARSHSRELSAKIRGKLAELDSRMGITSQYSIPFPSPYIQAIRKVEHVGIVDMQFISSGISFI